jgi:uncharacterized protein (DUF1501 family)
MRTSILLAGIVATTIGFGAVSTVSASAACLSPELATPPVSLSHNDMADKSQNGYGGASSQGYGYDKGAYLAALAKGNSCGTTEQSAPIEPTKQTIQNHPFSQSGNNS